MYYIIQFVILVVYFFHVSLMSNLLMLMTGLQFVNITFEDGAKCDVQETHRLLDIDGSTENDLH